MTIAKELLPGTRQTAPRGTSPGPGEARDLDLPSPDLIRLAQAGNRDALDRIRSPHQDLLLRIVRRRLGGRLRRVLESVDIRQNVLLSAAQRIHRFERFDEASLINWLAKLAERHITDQADYWDTAKRKLDRLVEMDAPEPGGGEGPPNRELEGRATCPPDRSIAEEHKAAVESALGELWGEYRKLVLLGSKGICPGRRSPRRPVAPARMPPG